MAMPLQSLQPKWRLLFKLLPWALLFVGAKAGIHQLQWEAWTFDSLTGTLFAAASFILAFMLSGTLRDYQTSIYMPIELANAIETIADANQLAAEAHPDYDSLPLTTELIHLTQNLLTWLEQQGAIAPIRVVVK